jgi:hypothetical protein
MSIFDISNHMYSEGPLVLLAVVNELMLMNVAFNWHIALCSPYVNRRFGGTYHLHL